MSAGMRLISHLDLIGPFRGSHTYDALGYMIVNNEKYHTLKEPPIGLALYPYYKFLTKTH